MCDNCSFLAGVGPGYPPCAYTPCHSHCPCTCPTSTAPSCHRGNHGPDISYQYSVHISTEPGHHCSSNPAHRGHPGEGLRRRGRAAEGGHRHFGARPLRRGGLRHSLKQRRARRLFTALSSTLTSRTPYTYIHLYTNTHRCKWPKQTRATGGYKPTALLFRGR